MGHLSDAAESMLYSQLKEALESIEGACDAIEPVDNQYFYALIHLNYGLILVTLNKNEEALPKFDKSLISFKHVGFLFGVAQDLENFGYIYLSRGDYEDVCSI